MLKASCGSPAGLHGGHARVDKGGQRLINLGLPLEQGLAKVAVQIPLEQGTALFFRQLIQVVAFIKKPQDHLRLERWAIIPQGGQRRQRPLAIDAEVHRARIMLTQ